MADPVQPPYTQPGYLVAGKYRVERLLGVGGMGIVVKANHELLEEPVALKFLLPDFADKPMWVTRFVREAKAARRIKGEHVTHIHDVAQLDGGVPYIVMEYLEGSDLESLLEHSRVLPVEEAVDCIVHACAALHEAHAGGIIHRDLKPANLFRTETSGGRQLVKVLDFGISKLAGEDAKALTNTSTVMGSALYMSPEQLKSSRDVDLRTDIYALGVTLYQLLSGRFPFNGETMPQLVAAILSEPAVPLSLVRRDLPNELTEVVHRAFAHKPDGRFATAAALAAALAPFASPEGEALARRLSGESTGRFRARQPSATSLPNVSTPAVAVEAQSAGHSSDTAVLPRPLEPEQPSAPGLPAAAPSAPGLPAAAPSAPGLPAAAPSAPGLPAAAPSAPKLPTASPSFPAPHDAQPLPPAMAASTAASLSRSLSDLSLKPSRAPLFAGIGVGALLLLLVIVWAVGGSNEPVTTETAADQPAVAAESSAPAGGDETTEETAEPDQPEDDVAQASSAAAASASASASAAGAVQPPKGVPRPRRITPRKKSDEKIYRSRQ